MSTPFAFIRAPSAASGPVLRRLWDLVLRLYYSVKPHVPVGLRLWLRRRFARRKRARATHSWPILESAGQPPSDWVGWPGDHRFALVLTHDVEGPRGLSRVRALAELEMSLGFRSSFNFVPEGVYRVSRELRDWLLVSGFEIGVHDHRHDGKLYKSHQHFMLSSVRINHYLKEWNAVGFRSGFMFHNLEWLKELNVEYDASTFDTDPFEPQSDGVGTIFPFRVGTAGNDGYVELPYTLVQDSTLFLVLQEESNSIWKQKLEWIRSQGGMALLNVHPDYTSFERARLGPDEFSVDHYAEFLTWLKQKHSGAYWHALPRNVAQFVKRKIAAAAVLIASSYAEAPFLLAFV